MEFDIKNEKGGSGNGGTNNIPNETRTIIYKKLPTCSKEECLHQWLVSKWEVTNLWHKTQYAGIKLLKAAELYCPNCEKFKEIK